MKPPELSDKMMERLRPVLDEMTKAELGLTVHDVARLLDLGDFRANEWLRSLQAAGLIDHGGSMGNSPRLWTTVDRVPELRKRVDAIQAAAAATKAKRLNERTNRRRDVVARLEARAWARRPITKRVVPAGAATTPGLPGGNWVFNPEAVK